MRALLIVNLAATTTSDRTRDVIVHALSSEVDLDVVHTDHRGHALELGRRARDEKVDLVVTFGGDGTVNEAVNGLLEDGPAPDGPALAVLPGGSTNVFSRTVGMAEDVVEATGQLLDGLRAQRCRRLGLATADGRWFTFTAGLGLDAEVVHVAESHRDDGGRLSAPVFVRAAVRQFYRGTDREQPALTVEVPGADPVPGVFLVIVQNASPWTYLGGLPVNPCPDASFDTGLDFLALRRLRTVSTLRHVRQILQPGSRPRGRDVVTGHDLPELTVWADRPVAFQVDGEPLGERMSVHLRAHPEALTVVV